MEIKVNVKAKENNGKGYSFKVNEVKVPTTEIRYLNENKVIDKLKDFPMEIIALPFIPTFFKAVGATLVAMPIGGLTGSIFTSDATTTMGTVMAVKKVDLLPKLMPLIEVIQEIALPVAIIVASWGCIEWIVGQPGYKRKIQTSIVGYSAIFGIPFIFTTLRDILGSLM